MAHPQRGHPLLHSGLHNASPAMLAMSPRLAGSSKKLVGRLSGRVNTPTTAALPVRPPLILKIPPEIGLEIIELALIATPPGSLAPVSRQFNALVCKIIYTRVVLRSLRSIALFHDHVLPKLAKILEARVKTLVVNAPQCRYDTHARRQLESIVAACTGVHTLALPRPGLLAAPPVTGMHLQPTSLVLQTFDAITPFEWDAPFQYGTAPPSPAAPVSARLTHLRICEPAAVWHPPRETLAFFGALPNLTHLALTRHLDPIPQSRGRSFSDAVFVEDVRAILAGAVLPRLEMLVVSLFPSQWPRHADPHGSLCSNQCLCNALVKVARGDTRLVLLAAGWDTLVETTNLRGVMYTERPLNECRGHGWWAPGNTNFWKNWRASDKRTVSLIHGWEPEILPDAAAWTYTDFPLELEGHHDFWNYWKDLAG